MLVVSGVQYVFDGYNLNRDVMVFAVVSVVSFVALRKVFKKKFRRQTLGRRRYQSILNPTDSALLVWMLCGPKSSCCTVQ